MLALGLLPSAGSAQAAASYNPSHTLVGIDFSRGELPLAAGKTRKLETAYSNWYSGLTNSAHPYEFARES
ncbi:hypothetical protein GCM10022223_38210 [Kineosporia mesophila]|uniref:Uncharacterized protein n=1 Tax=Kineosporia mesophila TaxID=566012 RepID=A0ABP6ZRE5_9ACTN|nr:hypothetical protein [Kineosporia mesophila]MCD5349757.1 hypothetical protein [Kineosporia mesophila]